MVYLGTCLLMWLGANAENVKLKIEKEKAVYCGWSDKNSMDPGQGKCGAHS